MQNILQKQAPQLRISHQSEVLQLRRALADLQTEMNEMKIMMNAKTINKSDRKIVLSSNGQHHYISLSDIIYCEADGSYTKIFIQKESDSTSLSNILISKTLKSVLELINCNDFIRCHQSYVINKNHVAGFESRNGFHLKLSNDRNIPVSRRNKKLVLASI